MWQGGWSFFLWHPHFNKEVLNIYQYLIKVRDKYDNEGEEMSKVTLFYNAS